MVNDVDAFHGCSHSGTVANIGLNEIDFFGAGRVFPDIKDGDLFAAIEETSGNEITKETGAAGDEMAHGVKSLSERITNVRVEDMEGGVSYG